MGGGIDAGGSLLIEDSTIQQNLSEGSSYGADGGGIYATANVEILRTTIVGNTAWDKAPGLNQSDGGGLWVTGAGSVTIEDSDILNNMAGGIATGGLTPGYGGGAFLDVDEIYIVNTNISSNTAWANGGGLWFRAFGTGATTVLDRCTFARNWAESNGGAIAVASPDVSGSTPTMQIWNSTLASNEICQRDISCGGGAGTVRHGPALHMSVDTNPYITDLVQTTVYENLKWDVAPDPSIGAPASTTAYSLHIQSSLTSAELQLSSSIIDSDCTTAGASPVVASNGGNVQSYSGTTPSCDTTTSDDFGSSPFAAGALADLYGGSNTVSFDPADFVTSAWPLTKFDNRTCLGDTAQSVVVRPSSGSTCYAGSYEP